MARLQCRDCGFDEEFVSWVGDVCCPSCRSVDVRAALDVRELTIAEIDRILGAIDGQAESIREGD